MPSIRIDRELSNEMYFVTLTVDKWYYVFDRHNRWQILVDSLNFCKQNKKLKVYGYVFMLNHIHLIIQAPNTASVLRDFKAFTSKKILKNIEATEPTVKDLFLSSNNTFQFWKKTNMPKLIESHTYFEQKLEYIHQNPVKKQYVNDPTHWIWSSAKHYYDNKPSLIEIDPL